MEGLLYLIVKLVVLGCVFAVLWWLVGLVESQFGTPAVFGKVARVILGLVAAIILVGLLLSLVGGGPELRLR